MLEPFGSNWSSMENQSCQVWNYGNRDCEPFNWSGGCVDGKVSGEGQMTYRGGPGTTRAACAQARWTGAGF